MSLSLSSFLAEVELKGGSNDSVYLDAAILGGNFLLSQMIQPSNHLPFDNLHILPTEKCSTGPAVLPRSVGTIIESFAVLADVTGNSSWATEAQQTLVAATMESMWIRSDGVVLQGSSTSIRNPPCCEHLLNHARR
jgi:hypothetical protein